MLPRAVSVVEMIYYFFAGQRIAMKRNGVLTYLHADHLGSIVATTSSGVLTSSRGYRAYGNYRRGVLLLPTDYRFTGQQQDASGLMDSLRSPQAYMNARYGACPELVEGT